MGNSIMSLCPEPAANEMTKTIVLDEITPSIETLVLSTDKVEYKDQDQLFNDKFDKIQNIIKDTKYLVLLLGENVTKYDQFVDLKLSSSYKMIPLPTDVHKSISTLLKKGVIKHVITSNQDSVLNLILPKENFTELYGNKCTEKCEACQRLYHRQFEVNSGIQRLCENFDCNGKLKPFMEFGVGDQLNSKDFANSIHHLEKADTILCLGAFYTKPFATFVETYKKRNEDLKIIIAHPYKTYREMDLIAKRSGVRVFQTSEFILTKLLKFLDCEMDNYQFDSNKYKNTIRELKIQEKTGGFFDSELLAESISESVETFRKSSISRDIPKERVSISKERSSISKERISISKDRGSLGKEKTIPILESFDKKSSWVEDPKETQNLIKKSSENVEQK